MKKILTIAALTLLTLGGCNKNNEEPSDVYDEGIEINGVVWATRNVDKPGTFAETPYDPGLLYEWNSKTGWDVESWLAGAADEILEDWDGTLPTVSPVWEQKNDPCPKGWHVPRIGEWSMLRSLEFTPPAPARGMCYSVRTLTKIADTGYLTFPMMYEFESRQYEEITYAISNPEGRGWYLNGIHTPWDNEYTLKLAEWNWNWVDGSALTLDRMWFTYVTVRRCNDDNVCRWNLCKSLNAVRCVKN
jgi:hypothetical protein